MDLYLIFLMQIYYLIPFGFDCANIIQSSSPIFLALHLHVSVVIARTENKSLLF